MRGRVKVDKSTHPTREQTAANQLQKLNVLLSEIIPSNRFYASKLNAPSTPPAYLNLTEFHNNCPTTQKVELVDDQANHPPYGSALTYPVSQYTRFNLTSGTTGQPLRWLDTPESWAWMLDNKSMIYRSADVTPEDRIFFPFSFGPFLGFWLAFEAATRIGCLCFPGGGLSSRDRIQTIVDQEITVVCCTPTYAIRLAQVAGENGLDTAQSKVRAIIVGGESGGSDPGVVSRIEALWPGARVYDHHGMTEIGSVSYACPDRPSILHIIESAYLAEVVTPQTLKPIRPGEVGELILTNLGRQGTPLLRYRTGDRGMPEVPGQCVCGTSDLALAGGILGRTDDMVVIRGINVFPSSIDRILNGFKEILEYQVQIRETRGLPELSLRLELNSEVRARNNVSDLVRAALRSSLTLNIPVEVVESGTLPRFEMKAKRWVRQ
jgi:phenylacetate-CoA ligase